jgi:hypothetical protein
MSARRKPPKPLPFPPVGLFSADELAGDRASSVAAGGSGSPPLSAAEVARLDSWLLDIARGARGSERAAGGSWRFGSKGAFVLHPDGSFFDFSAGAGGRGGLTLIRHLHLDAEPVAWARAWLGEHEGSGKFSPTEANDDTEADDDADRVALIEAIWQAAKPIGGTPAEAYLASRGLTPGEEDRAPLRWLAHARGEEGAMVAALTDEEGRLVAIQETFLTLGGAKSSIEPVRKTTRGPHDWNKRGLVRFGKPGAKLGLCEGVEDALTARAHGAQQVAALAGVGRLGRVAPPPGVETVVVVRDGDPPGSEPDLALWRGVVRFAGEDVVVLVTPRPSVVAGADADASKFKDINDLHQQAPSLVRELLATAAAPRGKLSAEVVNAMLDEASKLDATDYERGRRQIADMLGFSRIKALDDARAGRIKERLEAKGQGDPLADEEPWLDPVMDIGAVLDIIVAELGRYVVAPVGLLQTTALWAVQAHVLHREDLGVRIAPRLAIQSPMTVCGKTTLLEALACLTPRSSIVGSISPAAIFRKVHVLRPTLLIDEADNLLRKDGDSELLQILNSGHRRSTAFVERVEKSRDGQFSVERFGTFTGMAFAGIKEFPETLQNRCIVIALKRALGSEAPEHLTDGESPVLLECRRRIARWVKDLGELPAIERPKELANRLGDNWYALRQIACLAGGEWPQRALAAATGGGDGPEEQNGVARLLEDIRQVFEAKGEVRLSTKTLVDALIGMEETPWATVNYGRPISEYYLREHLKDLLPQTEDARKARIWKDGNRAVRGYVAKTHFEDAWSRYLGKGLPEGVGRQSKDQPKGPPSERPSEYAHADGDIARRNLPIPSETSATSATQDETQDISNACAVADGVADGVADAGPHAPPAQQPGEQLEQGASATPSATPSATKITIMDQSVSGEVADGADVSDGIPPLPRTAHRPGARGRRKPGGLDPRP